MDTHSESAAQHGHAAPSNNKLIWRTLGILTAITLVELAVGMFWAPGAIKANPGMKIWFNIFYLIMTLAKAYYIVSEFMHLGHEVRNLIMTIIFPLTLFIWFIIAFLWEGSSYKNLRDTYNKKPKVESKAAADAQKHSAAPGAHTDAAKPHEAHH
jgi:cytochrome c oxidase subunit IV